MRRAALLCALEIGEPALVNFRDAGERTDVFLILLGHRFEILDIPMEQFQVHSEGFDPFVNGHSRLWL
jgi:hypothetical protein